MVTVFFRGDFGVRLERQERFLLDSFCAATSTHSRPNALFHTIARGNDGQQTFLDSRDYQSFLEALSSLKKKIPFLVYAYCLMPNHFHLLI